MEKEKKTNRKKQYVPEEKKPLLFRMIRGTVKAVFYVPSFEGMENLPEGPYVLVGNHTQMNGPVISDLYLPGKHYTWCAGQMMDRREVPAYAYRDFWSAKPKAVRPFFRVASYLIAPLAQFVFTNANCIGVYHDQRIIRTLRETVEALQDGAGIVIFPECPEEHNNIINAFRDGFVDVAALYAKKEGKSLPFVPMYIAPSLKKVIIGKPVMYDMSADREQERERITAILMDRVTDLALSLPPHVVTPYSNVSKKLYKRSK